MHAHAPKTWGRGVGTRSGAWWSWTGLGASPTGSASASRGCGGGCADRTTTARWWRSGSTVAHPRRPAVLSTNISWPGGGIRRGEEPREAARRELREELGLSVRPEELVLAREMVCEWDFRRERVRVFELRLEAEPVLRNRQPRNRGGAVRGPAGAPGRARSAAVHPRASGRTAFGRSALASRGLMPWSQCAPAAELLQPACPLHHNGRCRGPETGRDCVRRVRAQWSASQRGVARAAAPLTARPVALTSWPTPRIVLHAVSAVSATARTSGDQARTNLRILSSDNKPVVKRAAEGRVDRGAVPFRGSVRQQASGTGQA